MDSIESWMTNLPAEKSALMSVLPFAVAGDMLRIDLEQISQFVPRFSARQHPKEDSTVARVAVCDSLMGCIAGYASFFHDFDVATTNGKWLLNGIHYKGGMYIHRLVYDYVIVPANGLAGDSSISGEKWLVAYDDQHQSYKSDLIGKVFISSFTSERADGDSVVNTYTIYLEVAENEKIKLTPTRTVQAGYWKLLQCVRRINGRVKVSQEPTALTCVQLGSDEYMVAKRSGVEMLSQKIKPAALWK
jgi:hypothetical protein